MEVGPASPVFFDAALERFRAGSDKDWGLTDCASFVVMEEHDLTAALTTDDQFVRAGFQALLLADVRDAT